MTTIMLHCFSHSPASLCAQTWCTWSRLWKLHMVGHGYWGEATGQGQVRMFSYNNEKLVYGSICSKLPAECTGIWKCYLINCSENMYSGGSELERPQSFWMQLRIHTNDTWAVTNNYLSMCRKSLPIPQLLERIEDDRYWSVNNFRSFEYGNWKLICLVLCINNALAACIGTRWRIIVTPPFWEWMSTECWQFQFIHVA